MSSDSKRVAQCEGIPFRFPRPDPIVQDMQTLEVATEQPLTRRLTRLGAAAQLLGRGLPFIREISRAIWDGSVDRRDQGDHLAMATARSGLDLRELDAAIIADTAKFDAAIVQNERDHIELGHWGVPTFVFNGEPFFGQDRIDLLIWRLKHDGLTKRKPTVTNS